MKRGQDRSPVRLAELVAALSLGIDLGFAQPIEHVLRECLISLRLAEHLGLDEQSRCVVYYTGLLLNVGCHSDAHEQVKWFGDDIALKSVKYAHPPRSVADAVATMRMLGSGRPPIGRLKMCFLFAISGHREVVDMIADHSRIAQVLAGQLALSADVVEGIGGSYEFWDGHGWPDNLKGAAIPLPARIVALAEFVEVSHRGDGVAAAQELARSPAGQQFDPKLAEVFCANAPYFVGHAQATAELCAGAAQRLGLPADEATLLRRAALVHGLGRLGVSNAILDKKGGLGPGESLQGELRSSPISSHQAASD